MQRAILTFGLGVLAGACSSKSDRTPREERAASAESAASSRRASAPNWRDACGDIADCRVRCDGGDARACSRLGERLFKGPRATRDLPGALAALGRACEGNDGLGCASLALMYQDGVGTERDIKRTAELYDKGCELGAGVACFNGAFLIDGDPRTTNPRALQLHDKARAAYRKSCDAGDLDWCTNLGVMLSMGIGQPKDEDGALVLFRKSCDARNVNGCIEVAQSMQRRQTKDDTDAARALLLDTCEREAGMACALAALMMSPSEEARVAELSERACDAGATLGCVTLARILVLRSPTLASPKATELLASSCDVGDSDACSLLALAKHQESDEAAALQLERRACLIGDAKACVDGMLDAKKANDRPLAIELAIRLCELGDPSGCQLAKAASGSR